MLRGTETCLCCITMLCHSNTSNVTEPSPNVKGIARLEHMVHNLMKKAGIKPSIKAIPERAIKNPSIYKSLVPSWFSFKDWDTMDADVFFNSNLKSLVTLNWKRFLLAIEISWENVHFLFLFFTRTNLARVKHWIRICQRRWTSYPKISSPTSLHTFSAEVRTVVPWTVKLLTYLLSRLDYDDVESARDQCRCGVEPRKGCQCRGQMITCRENLCICCLTKTCKHIQ